MNRTIVDRALEELFLTSGRGTTELLLVNHAAASPDRQGLDSGLSFEGRGQAQRLADNLSRSEVAAIYSAPSLTCRETARIIGGATCLVSAIVPNLAQIEIAEQDLIPEVIAHRFREQPRWDALPTFETSRNFRHRVIQAIEAIAAAHQGQRVVIVTHGCAVNAYLSMVLDIPRDMFFAPRPASVSAVRIRGDAYGVAYINADHSLMVNSLTREPAFTAR